MRLFVVNDPLVSSRAAKLSSLAARHAIPAIYSTRDFIPVGGPMSYGADL